MNDGTKSDKRKFSKVFDTLIHYSVRDVSYAVLEVCLVAS